MMSPSDEKRIVAMVDSFTKTVARNFSRNLKRAKANAEKHYSDEPVDYDCPFVDNELPYGRAEPGHPVIVDYFYHEEVRGSENTGLRNR